MARQEGIVPLNGTIGNITFYKSKDGFMAKGKSAVDANRIANDPAFQRTRENGAEFGRAGKAGKLLRTALRSLIQNISDSRMIARLTKEMMKAVKADDSNPRGARNVIDGDLVVIKGFEFNSNSKLGTTLFAPYSFQVNRSAGTLSINLPAFVPLNQIAAPGGTTHFKITSAGAEIDFANEVQITNMNSTGTLPWDPNITTVIDLVNNVTPNSTHALFLLLGIEFYQEVNGNMYPLKNGTFNALAIIEVSVV